MTEPEVCTECGCTAFTEIAEGEFECNECYEITEEPTHELD